jgi:hypothetical protein
MLILMVEVVPSSMTIKTMTINGVPYHVNEAGEVFVYSSLPPIAIGSYNKDTKVLALVEDWQTRMADWVVYYRNGLKEQTGVALEKAKQLQLAT